MLFSNYWTYDFLCSFYVCFLVCYVCFLFCAFCFCIVSPFVLSLNYFYTSLPTTATGWKPNCSIQISRVFHIHSNIIPLSYSKFQGPSWKSISSRANPKNCLYFWNKEVHCRAHNSPPTVPVLRQKIQVHILTSPSLNINFNNIPCHSSVPSVRIFLIKPCMHFHSPPCVPHDLHITLALTLSS